MFYKRSVPKLKKFQNKKPVIAIDGTAASGKGTLSRQIAKILRFDHLDTGLLYRYVAYKRIRGEEEENLDYKKLVSLDLTTEKITKMSSEVAQETRTRHKLLNFQRSFADNPPSGKGSVIDGRDIGTIVIPMAEVKFYVDAKLEVRAQRRLLDYTRKGIVVEYEEVLKTLEERDKRDKNRKNSPLTAHNKAILIDTTNKTRSECLNFVLKHSKALSK